MMRNDTDRLLVELTEKMQDFLNQIDAKGMPYLSQDTATAMAIAAMTVLVAIAEAQEAAIESGWLKTGEDIET